jgi:hypothetical protein
VLIVDTSALIALFDESDRHHGNVISVVEADDGPFVVSPYVVAELDHLILTRRGVAQEHVVLAELSSRAWELALFEATDLEEALTVIDQYHDQRIGVTDASLVVLARKYQTKRILTLDRRHFSMLKGANGRSFHLLPE